MPSIFQRAGHRPLECLVSVEPQTSLPPFVRGSALLLLVLGLILSGPARSGGLLTLDAAVQLVEKRSMQLRGQDAMIRGLRELEVAAGRLPDPVLRLSLDNVPVEGPMRYSTTADFMTMRSFGVMQTFVGSDKRQARSIRFAREADAAEYPSGDPILKVP